jgi:hypothetical protein
MQQIFYIKNYFFFIFFLHFILNINFFCFYNFENDENNENSEIINQIKNIKNNKNIIEKNKRITLNKKEYFLLFYKPTGLAVALLFGKIYFFREIFINMNCNNNQLKNINKILKIYNKLTNTTNNLIYNTNNGALYLSIINLSKLG